MLVLQIAGHMDISILLKTPDKRCSLSVSVILWCNITCIILCLTNKISADVTLILRLFLLSSSPDATAVQCPQKEGVCLISTGGRLSLILANSWISDRLSQKANGLTSCALLRQSALPPWSKQSACVKII